MATVIDLLRSCGQGAGPGGVQALRGPLVISAAPPRAMALVAPAPLVDAWSARTGRPTQAGHAVALAASRGGEAVAFMGFGQAALEDVLLLTLAQLGSDATSVALWLVPDAQSASDAADLWNDLDTPTISWQMVTERSGRSVPSRVIIATYDDVHQRLLAGADRGWRWLWPRLSLLAVPDLQRASGATGAHLTWLIRRVQRLAEQNLRIVAGAAPIAEPEETLGEVLGRPTRIFASEALHNTALVTLWHTDKRFKALRSLASELLIRRLAVTVLGRDEHETLSLRRTSIPAHVIGLPPDKARIAIVSGLPTDRSACDELLHRGYRLLIIMVADEPFEALCAAQPGLLLAEPAGLPVARGNGYVAGVHLQWAACEAPLHQAEIERWEAQQWSDMLLDNDLLRLAADDLLQPGEAALEHALDFVSATIAKTPFEVRDLQDRPLTRLLPHVADWWVLPGTLWQPGWTIAEHDVDATSAALVPDPEPGIRLPLLSVELSPRAEGAPIPARVGLHTLAVTRVKVQVKQRIEGQLVFRPGAAAQVVRLDRTRLRTWDAQACAIAIPQAPSDPRIAGWALGVALPHIVHLGRGDALVTYDVATQAIWIIETHPGGTGLAACIQPEVTRLMTMALALARAARSSPVYGALAHAELEWLEGLYSSEPPTSSDAMPLVKPAPPIPAARAQDEQSVKPSLVADKSRKQAVQARDDAEDECSGSFFEEVALEELEGHPAKDDGTNVRALHKGIRLMRKQHDQRVSAPRQDTPVEDTAVESMRFHRGQHVRCVPYGEGIIQDARIVAGRERLTIAFPEAGEIDVDPAMNMVRVLHHAQPQDDSWDPQIF